MDEIDPFLYYPLAEQPLNLALNNPSSGDSHITGFARAPYLINLAVLFKFDSRCLLSGMKALLGLLGRGNYSILSVRTDPTDNEHVSAPLGF